MKKYWLFVFVLALTAFIPQGRELTDLNLHASGTYYFYSSQSTACAFAQVTDNGNGYIISCDIKNAPKVRERLNQNVQGESFVTGADFDYMLFLKNIGGSVLWEEDTGENMCIYAYSPRLKYSVSVNGERVNIQIARGKGGICVGTPVILGSF